MSRCGPTIRIAPSTKTPTEPSTTPSPRCATPAHGSLSTPQASRWISATSHDLFLSLVMAAFSVDRSTMSPLFGGALALRSLMSPRGDAAAALRGTIQSHRAWLFRDAARREIAQRWVGFFKEFDVLLLPVTPTAAPGHHNKDHDRFGRTIDVDGVARSYWDQTKWSALANIAGAPATTMPITTNAAGLPIGIQAMGPPGGDRTTVEFAALLTEALGGYRIPPQYRSPVSEHRLMRRNLSGRKLVITGAARGISVEDAFGEQCAAGGGASSQRADRR